MKSPDPLFTLDAAALKLGVDRRTLAKAIDADRFTVAVDHGGHRHSPRYRLHEACEALAQWRQRQEPRIQDPEPVVALAALSERLTAIAEHMDNHGCGFSEAVRALFPIEPEPPCPLCGEPHQDMPHPPKYLR